MCEEFKVWTLFSNYKKSSKEGTLATLSVVLYGSEGPFGLFKPPAGRRHINLMKVKVVQCLTALGALYDGDACLTSSPYRSAAIIVKRIDAEVKKEKREKKERDQKKAIMNTNLTAIEGHLGFRPPVPVAGSVTQVPAGQVPASRLLPVFATADGSYRSVSSVRGVEAVKTTSTTETRAK